MSNPRLLRAQAPALFILLALALAAFLSTPSAFAQANPNPPERMTYQGFLADGNGDPLGNTNTGPKNYDIIFRILGAQTGGPTNWTEQQTVTVDRGNFSVLLGEGTPVGSEPHNALSTLFATNTASDRYVEMTVKGIGVGNSDVTILPRLRLLTSPYAYLSKTAINANNLVNASGTALVSSSGGSVVIGGPVSATAFTGLGTTLSNINASLITTGTLANARLDQNPTVTGTVTAAAFSGNGGSLTALNGTNINNTSIDVGKLVSAVQQALCPVATIVAYAGDTAPAGWLMCDGTAYPLMRIQIYMRRSVIALATTGGNPGAFFVPDFRAAFCGVGMAESVAMPTEGAEAP
jgi:hypothetical protein